VNLLGAGILQVNDATANSARTWSIGRLLPRLMFFSLLLDLVLRFVPLDPLTFRAWEAMLRRYPNAVGPFLPSKHYHRDNSYGGVASIGNLPALRHYHSVDFTTDAEGFHNPPALAQGHPIGIVIGDSFSVGSELPEEQSLSAQLTQRFGAYFYNAGAPQPLRLRSLEAVARRLNLHHGLVIFEFLESRALEDPPAATPDGGRGRAQAFFFRAMGPDWTDRLGTPLNRLHASPLRALSAKLEKKIQDDTLLPNSFASFVIQERLRNGEPIVFLPAEWKSPSDPRKAAKGWAAYFAWYSTELGKDGLDLAVLLVPNRSTIYAPLLALPREVSASRETLEDFRDALQNAGVRTVALRNRYVHDAAILLDQKKYLYFLDDTHWNGHGTAEAADEIFKAFH
jgi:SGNH hydrolase-like domain, acetyltransferase AlgX